MSVDARLWTQPDPSVPPRRPWRTAALIATVVVVIAVLLGYFAASSQQPVVQRGRVLVATAAAGTTRADLLRVEQSLAERGGPTKPGTQPSAEEAALRRAGIASMRLDDQELSVTFLPDATAGQVDAVRAAILEAPAVAGVSDGLDLTQVARDTDAAVGAGPDSPPGIIVTASTPNGMWTHAAGVGDLQDGRPMSPALQYRIGSATKTLTAVVVLQLVDEGRVSLDEPASTYLAGALPYPASITVRDLLSHTSGLVDMSHFGRANVVPERDVPRVRNPRLRAEATRALREARTNPALTVPPQVYLAVVSTRPLAFRPGTKYTYSNTDYVVLTMLVERITGRSLAAEFDSRIFAPLGLERTFLATTPAFRGPFSRSYATGDKGARVEATDDLALGMTGSGDVVSTAADMTVFFRALLTGRLLPPALLTQMKAPSRASVKSGTPYGFAIEHHATTCGLAAVGHGGAIGGYLTDVYASDDGSTVVVYVQNAIGNDSLGALRQRFANAAFCEAAETH